MPDRDDIVDFLRRQLLGPASGRLEETLSTAPSNRYTLGLLFPVDAVTSVAETHPEEIVEDSPVGEMDSMSESHTGSIEDPIALSSQIRPSSLGISALVSSTARFKVVLNAGVYAQEGRGTWTRRPLSESVEGIGYTTKPTDQKVMEGRARLHVQWRALGEGNLALVTATMVNDRTGIKLEDVLAQCEIRLEVLDGEWFQPYPSPTLDTTDEEEEELRLRYSNTPAYGVGHGCAASWTVDPISRLVHTIQSDSMPTRSVPPITPGSIVSNATDIAWLADKVIPINELTAELHCFVDEYAKWANSLENPSPGRHGAAFDRITMRISVATERMRSGIKLLESSPEVLSAFRLAQRAMYMQMRMSSTEWRNGEQHPPITALERKRFRWRPFQLAYQLLTLDGIHSETSEDRRLVDLLWFPTGGGKTEAYLALAAFTVFLRRLSAGERGLGCAVITRYTLRLLTVQQFRRYTALAAACEIIRKSEGDRLGSQPIRAGLWVGGSETPNSYEEASETLAEALESKNPKNPFPLAACPLCATGLLDPTAKRQKTGFSANSDDFISRCLNPECDFASEIPVVFVDDKIYDDPPAFVIGTVDKFARLAWEPRAGALIAPKTCLPPSLIIQDELHLLSGPLGTIAGLYEAGIAMAIEERYAPPKIIASTATIRRAGDQCRALFDRDVAVFPPPGPTADDSFFARIDEDTRESGGRKFIGVMAQSHTPTMSLVRTIAALAQAPLTVGLSGDLLDAYWTIVAYHNSLRELGSTLTAARDDIPSWIAEFAESEETTREFSQDRILELTSNAVEPIDDLLSKMEESLSDHASGQGNAMDLIACTNMLSVGVDVSRLGLMVVNGQPKTTAEYIQATSRVGRSSERPGIIVAHYSSTKPRDRSHYENFISYHNALYRYVEPTSVTPFSLPARDRALHATLVIIVRHGFGFSKDEDAGLIALKHPELLRKAAAMVLQRAESVDPTEAESTSTRLSQIVDQWIEWAELGKAEGHALVFNGKKKTAHRALLCRFDDTTHVGFKTLDSMRNVDRTCRVNVRAR